MSQRSVEQALGKLVTDEAFRREFFLDPDGTSVRAGLELSRTEVCALQRVPRGLLAKLCDSLEDRICRLVIPGRQEEHS